MLARPIGRPREFDSEVAIYQATRLFWRHGYSGTSTRMLTAALGISSSSLYAAFGSKSNLFEQAVHSHIQRYSRIYEQAVVEPGLGEVVERLLVDSVLEFTQSGEHYPGCLTTSAAMADTSETLDVRAFADERQRADEQLLRTRIRQAIQRGEAHSDLDADALTNLVRTVWHGLSVRANLGEKRSELLKSARQAHLLVTTNLIQQTRHTPA